MFLRDNSITTGSSAFLGVNTCTSGAAPSPFRLLFHLLFKFLRAAQPKLQRPHIMRFHRLKTEPFVKGLDLLGFRIL